MWLDSSLLTEKACFYYIPMYLKAARMEPNGNCGKGLEIIFSPFQHGTARSLEKVDPLRKKTFEGLNTPQRRAISAALEWHKAKSTTPNLIRVANWWKIFSE